MARAVTVTRGIGLLALLLVTGAGCGALEGADEETSQAARRGGGCSVTGAGQPGGGLTPGGPEPCPLPPGTPPKPRTAFYAQNMGLLPDPFYKGSDRRDALGALIKYLRENRPEVVGLSELFVPGEQWEIRRQLGDIYSYAVDGPDELDAERSGGLLLLSRFPIVASNQTIYRMCRGDDCLTNKGILHARIAVPEQTEVDVFLSHLQSADPLPVAGVFLGGFGGADAPTRIKQQLDVLSDFVKSVRDIRLPTIMMGDFNTDGRDPILYSDMMARLGRPIDLWTATEEGPGITRDSRSSFAPSSGRNDWNDPYRHQRGTRLDYLLAHDGTRFAWRPGDTEVVLLFNSNGRDSSDHYGVLTRVDEWQARPPAPTPPRLVQTRLKRFHCFLETAGVTGPLSRIVNTDEVVLEMSLTASGSTSSVRTGTISGVHRSQKHDVRLRGLVAENPSDGVTLTLKATEVDPFLIFGSTGNSVIGTGTIRLSNADLADLRGDARELAVRLEGVGGEYVLVAEITVD